MIAILIDRKHFQCSISLPAPLESFSLDHPPEIPWLEPGWKFPAEPVPKIPPVAFAFDHWIVPNQIAMYREVVA